MRIVQGTVHAKCYEVNAFIDGELVEEYTAGNNPCSSSNSVEHGVPASVLFEWCKGTAKEMAAEHGIDCVDVRFAKDW
jgi:hypothetical protein